MLIADTLIEIPAWGSVTILELIWALSGAFSAVLALIHLRPLIEDWVASMGEPVGREITWSYLRRELVRLYVGVAIMGVGVYACVIPNPYPGPSYVTPVGIVLTVVLFSINFANSAQSIGDWRSRHVVYRLIKEGKTNGHAAPAETADLEH